MVEDKCAGRLTELDAFLYGVPGGLIIAGLLLVCFLMFGYAMTERQPPKKPISASSITRKDVLGKKHKRGPPPSEDLRPVDMKAMALREDAPDDIKAMVQAGKLIRAKSVKKSKSVINVRT